LIGDEAKGFPELKRLHYRFLAATIHANILENGRPYGVQSNRQTLNDFIVDHVGDDLGVMRGPGGVGFVIGAWGAAEKQAFMTKYEVTDDEADQARSRLEDIANGKVF
jgi:hypothetical protein